MKRAKKKGLVLDDISSQKEIAEVQLQRLKEISRNRLLTYDEAKIYDIIVKHLASEDDGNTIPTDSTRLLDTSNTSNDKLLAIAQNIDSSFVDKAITEVSNDKEKGNK